MADVATRDGGQAGSGKDKSNPANPVEVGVYGAAWSIAGMLLFIPQAFSFLALPMFSKLFSKQSITELREIFKKITGQLWAGAPPMPTESSYVSKNLFSA